MSRGGGGGGGRGLLWLVHYIIIFVSAKYSEAGGVLQINYLRVISHFYSVHTFGCIKTVKVCGEIYSSPEIESKLIDIWQLTKYIYWIKTVNIT